jgi:hypothetical protein
MLRRILPEEAGHAEAAYANIKTVLLIPAEEGKTLVVFDTRSEWSYMSDKSAEELFKNMSTDDNRLHSKGDMENE